MTAAATSPALIIIAPGIALAGWRREMESSHELWPHQQRACRAMAARSGYYLAHEPRTGKTVTTIAALRSRYGANFLTGASTRRLSGLRPDHIKTEDRILLLNPEILIGRKYQDSSRRTELTGWSPAIHDWIFRQNRDVILIVDEAHRYLVNPASATYRQVSLLAANVKICWLLSGTNIEKSGIDLHNQLRLVPGYPMKWESNNSFGNKYCHRRWNRFIRNYRGGGQPGGWEFLGLREDRIDALTDKIRPMFDRVLLQDCMEVPAEQRIPWWVDPQDYLPTTNPTVLDSWHDYVEAKVRATYDFIESEIDPEEPLVVFGFHQQFVNEMTRKLAKRGKGAAAILGETSLARREELRLAFQQGRLDALVCNYDAMSLGVDLSRARITVHGEPSQRVTSAKQAEDRIKGIAQKSARIVHYYILMNNSQDVDIWDNALRKGKAIDMLDASAREVAR